MVSEMILMEGGEYTNMDHIPFRYCFFGRFLVRSRLSTLHYSPENSNGRISILLCIVFLY